MAVIAGFAVAQALADAGVVSDLKTIQRIVIDIQADKPVTVFVQRLGQSELAELLPQILAGASVSETGDTDVVGV